MWIPLETGKGLGVAGQDRRGSLLYPTDGKLTVGFRAKDNWMNPNQKIRLLQKAWAESRGLSVDPKGYVPDVGDNLRRPLSTRARQGFGRGAGSELSGHMKALHSSSALVVNFFDYWTERDSAPLLAALEVDAGGAESLDFEAQFPTGLDGTPPHLDVAMGLNSGMTIGVESKFTEHLDRSTIGKSRFEASYFPCSGGMWTNVGLPECQSLAEELHDQRHRFEFLDPWQLLKHALGLATNLGSRFSLRYLYYDFPGDRPEAHRQEIQTFASRVGAEIGFKASTYQEVYSRLLNTDLDEPEYLDYLGYLGARYFSTV
jgi:hypothetical protein